MDRRTGLYQPLDFFVVRAPLLPVERYLELSASASAPASQAPASSAATLLPPDPKVRHALAVASLSLFRALQQTPPGHAEAAARRGKLLRYLIRMSTRPTPFGLFAGVALGRWADRTDLALADTPVRTRTRPDMGWLLRLVLALEARPEVRRQLRMVANTTAFAHDGRVHLMERSTGAQGPEPDVSVRATTVVRRVLALARRPVGYQELAAAVLPATPGATHEKLERLLDELWRQGLLLTELRPPLTADPARHVLRRLAEVPAARSESGQLRSLLEATAAFDGLTGDDAVATLPQLRKQARAVHEDGGDVLQVDAALPLGGEGLSRRVAEDAARAVELLLRLHPAPGGPAHLAAYRRTFEARYGHGRFVPLLELLDPRFGLGPPPRHGHAWHGRDAGQARAAHSAELLFELGCRALQEQTVEVELDRRRLAELETWSPTPETVPPSLELAAVVVAPSPAAIDRGDYRLVVGPSLGASAAGKGLGRFADLLGPEAVAALEQAARAEAARQPGCVWAELTYLPRRLRSANVAVRPRVRSHEIAVGLLPGGGDEAVIHGDELAVGLLDGRLRLWWPARDVEVVVSAGHMLNSGAAPQVCRFLQELRMDGVTQLSDFDWGQASRLPFLPRVRAGRIVLRLAEWRLDATVASRELGLRDRSRAPGREDRERLLERLAAWRERWRVPRHVYLTAADNRLLLDLEDSAQAGQLLEELRRPGHRSTVLQEPLPGPEDAWLPGPGGRYASEIVVPLVRREGDPPPPGGTGAAVDGAAGSPGQRSTVRLFAADERVRRPGSDWLFLKLYCAGALQDELIAGPVRAFAERLVDTSHVDRWFFVRYADPDPHLRLRFHGEPDALGAELLAQACVWAGGLTANGACTRFTVDVYERELERYGGVSGMEVSESVFAADSVATGRLLALLLRDGEPPTLDRVDLAVLTVDDLLAGLGYDEQARTRWCSEAGRPSQESGVLYRQRKDRLRRLLSDQGGWPGDGASRAVRQALAARRAAMAPLGARLRSLAEAGELSASVQALSRSYAHLHCNRLLGSDGASERLVLGLLQRTRTSLAKSPLP